MSIICKIDGKEFKDEKSLHFALKGYGLNKVKYYQKYFERRDLLTNELIKARLKDPLDTLRLTLIEELTKYEADELQEANKLLKLYSIIFDSLRDINENVRRKSLNFLYMVLIQYDHMKNFKVFDLE